VKRSREEASSGHLIYQLQSLINSIFTPHALFRTNTRHHNFEIETAKRLYRQAHIQARLGHEAELSIRISDELHISRRKQELRTALDAGKGSRLALKLYRGSIDKRLSTSTRSPLRSGTNSCCRCTYFDAGTTDIGSPRENGKYGRNIHCLLEHI